MGSNIETIELYSLMTSHIVSKVITIACELYLDKLLKHKTQIHFQELAKQFDFHPAAMYRFLRVLDAYNVIELMSNGNVSSGRLCPFLHEMRGPHLLKGYGTITNLCESLKNNTECFSMTYETNFKDLIATDPSASQNLKLWSKQSAKKWLLPAVLSHYSFSSIEKICAMGCDPYFIAFLLQRNKNLFAIYLTSDKNEDEKIFKQFKVDERITIKNKDTWGETEADCDLYLFCRHLLSYDDNKLLEIINKTYHFSKKESKLLIIDFLMVEREHQDYKLCVTADINILSCLNGRLRSKQEWLELIQDSSYSVLSFKEINSNNTNPSPILPMFIIEAM